MENIIKKNLILISGKEASYVSRKNLFDKLVSENVIVEFDNKKITKKFIKQWNSRKFIGEFTIAKKVSSLVKQDTIFSIYERYGSEKEDVYKTIYKKISFGFGFTDKLKIIN